MKQYVIKSTLPNRNNHYYGQSEWGLRIQDIPVSDFFDSKRKAQDCVNYVFCQCLYRSAEVIEVTTLAAGETPVDIVSFLVQINAW